MPPELREQVFAPFFTTKAEGVGTGMGLAVSRSVALAMLGEARFDAIVSDLRMPDIDGASLWRAVRQHDPALALRMLFVTGDTLSPGARVFLDQSRCAGLDKPFTKATLLLAVQQLLQGPR